MAGMDGGVWTKGRYPLSGLARSKNPITKGCPGEGQRNDYC